MIPTQFLDHTVSILSRQATIQPDGSVSQNPVVKVANLKVSLQPQSGSPIEFAGKPDMQCTHWLGCNTIPSAAIGDLIQCGSTKYEITYFDTVDSFAGSYFYAYLTEIRE